MKKILITGANSYVGTNVEKWLLKEPDNFQVETLDMKNSNWITFDFSKFDIVFHVAGIAHVKESKKNKDVYYKVNRDLAVEVAVKAKQSGIKKFIFMSSMSIFGKNVGIITNNTIPRPKTYYGLSKFDAEISLNTLSDDKFEVVIFRAPMIYGYTSPGNFSKFRRFILRSSIFIRVQNRRSAVYIDTFCEYVKYAITNKVAKTLYPHNSDYLNIYKVTKQISDLNSHKIYFIPFPKFIFNIIELPFLSKIFGSLYYDKSILNSNPDIIENTTQESIDMIERKYKDA